VFATLHNPNPSNYKRFRDGLSQLLQEGVVQQFSLSNSASPSPVLAAVGPLQFEVVQYRLEAEYGAPTKLEHKSWKFVRWVVPEYDRRKLAETLLPTGCALGEDADGQPVIFFTDEWAMNWFAEKKPEIKFSEQPFETIEVST
jgi:peptide chain release factor 3